MTHIVTSRAKRPASDKDECFYCNQPIGAEHGPECVLVKRKVLVRMIVEYEVTEPAHWDGDHIESHRNDGTWCASNAIDELQKLDEKTGCLCDCTEFEFEFIDYVSEPFLDEDR